MNCFRPDFALRHLRHQQQSAVEHHHHHFHRHKDLSQQHDPQFDSQQQSILMLRWLRTLSIDCRVPKDKVNATVEKRLLMQQRSVLPCAVQRVVVDVLRDRVSTTKLQQYVESLPLLTVLDLHVCNSESVTDSFLCAVASVHHSRMQRLYLPRGSSVSQSALNRFTELEELDVSWCQSITNVDFCAATLRVLYANDCDNLTSAGLQNATKLEVLHVDSCDAVTSVSPCAHCLLELNAACGCGIDSAALSQCYRLQVLNASYNKKIGTLEPFAGRLRELHAAGYACALDDAALAEATQLLKLNASYNDRLTMVAPPW